MLLLLKPVLQCSTDRTTIRQFGGRWRRGSEREQCVHEGHSESRHSTYQHVMVDLFCQGSDEACCTLKCVQVLADCLGKLWSSQAAPLKWNVDRATTLRSVCCDRWWPTGLPCSGLMLLARQRRRHCDDNNNNNADAHVAVVVVVVACDIHSGIYTGKLRTPNIVVWFAKVVGWWLVVSSLQLMCHARCYIGLRMMRLRYMVPAASPPVSPALLQAGANLFNQQCH